MVMNSTEGSWFSIPKGSWDFKQNITSIIEKSMFESARNKDKALRFFFLMMFRQPALCCTQGDFEWVVKDCCIEYRFNGVPFAQGALSIFILSMARLVITVVHKFSLKAPCR